jgi:death-on-curing protein
VIYLRSEDVAQFNAVFCGKGGVGDVGLLESACMRPQTTVFGEDAYPSIWEKAAALLHSLACNHAFVSGNKRTAWMATTVFLEVNGHPLDPMPDLATAEAFVIAVAMGELRDIPAIASELVKFCR